MRSLPKWPLALAGVLAGAAHGFAASIDTATGPVEIAAVPRTVAVYDIAAIDTIDALGVTIAGVPDNLYLDRLKGSFDDAEVVGTLFEPDLEALNALQPDLVVVGGRSSTQLDQVSRVAPAIDMTLWGDDLLADARERIADYGMLFGREAEASELAARFDAAIANAKAAAAGKGTALLVMTNGPKISAYGAGSRFGWVYAALGIEPAADNPNAGAHGDAVSFEFVAEADPDWLIVVDRASAIGSGEQNARATLDNELVRGTKAWKAQQVVYLPAAEFYIAAGGARATINVFDALAEAFSSAR